VSERRRALVALGALLAAALGLRLWSIDHGLPSVFNPDEELHFVPIAVDMFRGSFNPGYFENPPALTYVLHLVFRLRFAQGFPLGGTGFAREFLADPESAFLTARVTVALIGTAVVGLTYWAAARFHDRRVGLVAAALMAFAFLPAYYSKQALNDVVTLAPVCVALVGCLLVAERGALGHWVLAGAAIGAATATKYTAGAMLATLGLAALLRLTAPAPGGGTAARGREARGRDPFGRVVAGLACAGGAFALAFLILNPFALLDAREFASEVVGQGGQAGAVAKLGQTEVPGWLYYLWTLTWGLGWLPAVALFAGALLAARADWRRTALLAVFPLLLFLFLGAQARYFGRWLLPAYPALVILAAYATVRLADALGARTPARRTAVVVALGALLVLQGLASTVRVNAVLARADTRALAREWLDARALPGTRLVLEPFVPADYLAAGPSNGPDRYERWPVRRPFQAYEKRQIGRGYVDRYRRGGYCWVVTASHQKQRGLAEGLATARVYYAELDRATAEKTVFSPYEASAEPPPFSFDLSFNHLPPEFLRPGPLVEVHRLADCVVRRGPREPS